MNNTHCLHQNKLDAVMESRDAPCIETCFFHVSVLAPSRNY